MISEGEGLEMTLHDLVNKCGGLSHDVGRWRGCGED